MTRRIGGQTTWGSLGEAWAQVDPAAASLSGTSWAQAVGTTDIEARLAQDPAASDGVSVGSRASGTLRFVVQMLNPTAASDSVWGTALWGTGHWSASVGTWVDVTSRVRGLDWTQGASSPSGRSDVGTSTITFNNRDGLMSPWAVSGAYVGAGASWIRAGCLVRFGMLRTTALAAGLPALSSFEPIFTGQIETVDEDDAEYVDGWVTITVTETTAAVAVGGSLVLPLNGRKLTATIHEAIVSSGWPYQTFLDVPDEDVSVMATVLAGGSASSRLDLLCDCMHWDWVSDGRGRIEIVRRHYATSSSGITFASAPTAGQMPMVHVKTYSNIERVVNDITAGRAGATDQEIEDTRSSKRFGVITSNYNFPRSDLVLETDAQVLALIARVLSFRAWDDQGIQTVELDADMDPVNLPAVMTYIAAHGREGASFVVHYVHPSGAVLEEIVVIEGQTHTIIPEGDQIKWLATLRVGHSGVLTESG